MNRLHGKSNSGEGGEEIERLDTDRCSAIKQWHPDVSALHPDIW